LQMGACRRLETQSEDEIGSMQELKESLQVEKTQCFARFYPVTILNCITIPLPQHGSPFQRKGRCYKASYKIQRRYIVLRGLIYLN